MKQIKTLLCRFLSLTLILTSSGWGDLTFFRLGI